MPLARACHQPSHELERSGLREQYWATLHPLLDPEDNNDPTQRLNILRALTVPRGSVTGWLTVVDYLYATPLNTATKRARPAATTR